jgi:CheY-like chemotaxis protein
MPGMNGLNTAQLLRQKHPALKILIISQHDANQLLPRSLEAGDPGKLIGSIIPMSIAPNTKPHMIPSTILDIGVLSVTAASRG